MINILDCTIRDGSYATNYYWDAADIEQIVKTLSKIGIKYIEVGNGTGLGAYRKINGALDDESYMKHSVPYKYESKIGSFFIPGIGTKNDIDNFKNSGGDFIRIGIDSTETEKSIEFIEYAKSLGLMVHCNFMKSYAISKYQFIYRSNDIIKAGADCVYVVDSAGGMLPEQISEFITLMKKFYTIDVGFHGHNNLLMANANSLVAIQSGATFVDSTLLGLGRGAGNAHTESLVALLQKANILNKQIDILQLSDLSKKIICKISNSTNNNMKRNVSVGMANFHDSNTPLLEKYANKYSVNAEKLLIEVSKINVVNPSEELFECIANNISKQIEGQLFCPRFYHKKY